MRCFIGSSIALRTIKVSMPQLLWPALEQGATLLTANMRLARQFRIDFDNHQKSSGRKVWPTAEIYPWPVWIARMYGTIFTAATVMNTHQELALWQRAIAEDSIDLLDIESTAKAAARAWRLVETWNVPMDDASFDKHPEGQAFRRWSKRFEKQARENGWITIAGQERAVASSSAAVPEKLFVAGFDEYTPLQNRVLAKCRAKGCVIETWSAGHEPTARAYRAGFEDSAAEISAAAGWARQMLDSNPQQNIAIIATGLAKSRATLDRALEDSLGTRTFNISLGLPLNQWPLAATALLVLRIAQRPEMSIDDWGRILRSPFLYGGERELTARGQLEGALRNYSGMNATVAMVLARGGCPLFSKALGDFDKRAKQLPRKQSLAQWAQSFTLLLSAIGWPGERVLISEERQTLARWNEAVSTLASLEAVEGMVGINAALEWLRRIAQDSIYQPDSGAVPVQVLEGLQAAGSRFDAIWILGMEDRAWPAPSRPEPFLPRQLQLQLDLPHSSADREYRFSSELFERLRASAPLVIASYPTKDGEENLRPSAFIAKLAKWAEMPPTPDYWQIQRNAVSMELFEDSKAGELPEGAISGSSAMLKNTAQCPFKGFAMKRLEARGVETPQPGLNARDRGSLMHKALQNFWLAVRTQQTLAGQSGQERMGAIHTACRTAVEEFRGPALSDRFIALEIKRLEKLLLEWLALEVKRPAFEVIETEKEIEITLSGVNIKGRMDRIDRLGDGREILVDYKSTLPPASSWQGDRMEDPQLPLYAVHRAADVAALTFAQLKTGLCKFQGLAAEEKLIEKVPAISGSWSGQLETWRANLTRYAEELRTGHALVSPTPKACEWCGLEALCRIATAVETQTDE